MYANRSVYMWRKYCNRKHAAWCKKVNRRMPDLFLRVFALRQKPYAGCGAHYTLEKLAGRVLRDLQEPSTDIADHLITEILVEDLFNTLVKAERSASQIEASQQMAA